MRHEGRSVSGSGEDQRSRCSDSWRTDLFYESLLRYDGFYGALVFFSNYLYSDEIKTVFPKVLPHAFIYTMNMTEEHVKQYGIRERFAFHEGASERFFGSKASSFVCL